MSIKSRITVLVALLLVGFAVTLGVVRWREYRARSEQIAEEQSARILLLEHWLDVTGKALPLFTADLAESHELPALLAKGELGDLRTRLEAAMNHAGLHGVWLASAGGEIRLQVGNLHPPLESSDFISLVSETPRPRFFVIDAGRVVEYSMRRIGAAGQQGGDWVIAARVWDDAYLAELQKLTESKVTLAGAHEPEPAPSEDRVVIIRPLVDWSGRPIRSIRVEHVFTAANQPDPIQVGTFFVFGVLLIAGIVVAVDRWVVRPLTRIGESLKSGNPALVASLVGHPSELGHVARLVQDSFEQRAALENEISERKRAQAALEKSEDDLKRTMEERVRLGRDLHDGVIQSLYAAGMGLAGVRPLLTPEQTEAAARLEQTRATLNETIHDVRNFIVGLEPEALRSQTFTQAVRGLVEITQAIRPAQTEVKIDESLASRLTLSQRVHALQIAREALSNALRHGNANHISIALRMAGHFAEFEVVDDGQGFDMSVAGPGRGLANFAQRARELGGELTVDSAPGRGTTVRLTFSFHHS